MIVTVELRGQSEPCLEADQRDFPSRNGWQTPAVGEVQRERPWRSRVELRHPNGEEDHITGASSTPDSVEGARRSPKAIVGQATQF